MAAVYWLESQKFAPIPPTPVSSSLHLRWPARPSATILIPTNLGQAAPYISAEEAVATYMAAVYWLESRKFAPIPPVEAIPMYVEELLLLLTCYVEGTS